MPDNVAYAPLDQPVYQCLGCGEWWSAYDNTVECEDCGSPLREIPQGPRPLEDGAIARRNK